MTNVAAILGHDVVVTLRGEAVRLRPTLGAAMAAHRIADGFGPLMSRIDDLDTAVCAALIAAGAERVETDLWPWSGAAELAALREPLIEFVALLAAAGERSAPEPKRAPSASTVTHDQFFVMLFEVATGWLGWTAAAALSTPMPAILAARSGRLELLRSIFGGAQTSQDVPLDQKVRAFMMMRGGTRVERL